MKFKWKMVIGLMILAVSFTGLVACEKKTDETNSNTEPTKQVTSAVPVSTDTVTQTEDTAEATGTSEVIEMQMDIAKRQSMLTVGNGFFAVLLEDGTIKVWGEPCGEYSDKKGSVEPSAWSGIAALADSNEFLCAIDKEGKVVSACDLSQVIDSKIWAGAGTTAGFMSVDGLKALADVKGVVDFVDSRCLLNDGTILGKIDSSILSGRTVAQLELDNCLFTDGTVYYGLEFPNEERTKWKEWKNIVQICKGSALDVNGKVWLSGEFVEFGKSFLESEKKFVMLASSYQLMLGLCEDGTIVAELIPGQDELGLPDFSEWKDLVSIDAGENYVAGLASDGTLFYSVYDEKEQKWNASKETLK